jgi:hypothetical protein
LANTVVPKLESVIPENKYINTKIFMKAKLYDHFKGTKEAFQKDERYHG